MKTQKELNLIKKAIENKNYLAESIKGTASKMLEKEIIKIIRK